MKLPARCSLDILWTFASAIKKKELNLVVRGTCMFDENLVIFRAITKCCHFRAKTTRRRNDDGDDRRSNCVERRVIESVWEET